MRTVLMRALITTLALALTPPGPARAQEKPQILVLGTFHMGNPGRDVHNMEADDMLSDRRQREIGELVEVLATFRPTVIAVESSVTSDRVPEAYADYLTGEYELTRNETDQIGFRLARRMGLETVHPVDVGGEFPFYRVQNWAIANDRKHQFDSLQAATGESVERQGRLLRESTVLQTLEYMNADSTVVDGVGSYYGYVPFGEPYEYAGPELLAEWFRRNVHIYHNIRTLASSPNERILVVYGAGHLGWLRQMVEDDPVVELVTLEDVLEQAR